MVNRPGLSKGEMEVARVLWEVGPAPVRGVHEAMLAQREIEFSTVQTFLRRLQTKGYATSILKDRIRIYSSKTKPRTVIRETVDDLVLRLFGGETMPLVRHLIEERGIDANELAELRKLLSEMEPDKTREGHG